MPREQRFVPSESGQGKLVHRPKIPCSKCLLRKASCKRGAGTGLRWKATHPAWVLRFFLLLSFASHGVAGAVGPVPSGRFYEPVEVPGELFPEMTGKAVPDLGLYTWREGAWRPVLFQVDERTPEGDFVMTRGEKANPEEGDGTLDDRDVIVFMAREAGQKAPENMPLEKADELVPIELRDPCKGESRWVYLASFEKGAPKNEAQPVSSLLDHDGVSRYRFPTYAYDALINSPEERPTPTIYIDKLWILPAAGGSGRNIIDRQKTRGMITFLGGIIKIRFNESIVNGGILAYKPGPVRILSHSYMYPRFPLGIKGPGFSVDSILVDSLTLTATTIRVPFNPGTVMHKMKLALGMDLTPEAKGMMFYNSENPQGFRIDGRMSEQEGTFCTTKDAWRVITGPPGTQIIVTRFDPELFRNGEILTTYNDDETDAHPPENHAGDVGAVFDELTIKSLPAGSYRIDVFGCIPRNFYDPRGLNRKHLEEILDIQKEPIVIRVGDKKTKNRGGLPQVLMRSRKGE